MLALGAGLVIIQVYWVGTLPYNGGGVLNLGEDQAQHVGCQEEGGKADLGEHLDKCGSMRWRERRSRGRGISSQTSVLGDSLWSSYLYPYRYGLVYAQDYLHDEGLASSSQGLRRHAETRYEG